MVKNVRKATGSTLVQSFLILLTNLPHFTYEVKSFILICLLQKQTFPGYLRFDGLKYHIKTCLWFQSCYVHKNWVHKSVRRGWEKRVHHGPSGAIGHPGITRLTFLKVGNLREEIGHADICANNTDKVSSVITWQCYGCQQPW